MTDIMSASIDEARAGVIDSISVGCVPLTVGSPGIGKTEMHRAIAEHFKLLFVDIRLPTHDVTDLSGFPWPDHANGKMGFLPTELFPLEGEAIPDGYDGWYIHFDEITSCRDEMQVACYKVLLDKMINQTKIHPRAVMACSGNLAGDNAIVNGLSTAMQSRLIHFEVRVDTEAFQKWAGANDIDYRIKGFLNFRPDLLHSFDPDHDDFTYACPRTYYFHSKFLKRWGNVAEFTNVQRLVMNGTIGHAVTHEFITYCAVYKDLITIDEIIKDPKNAPISDKLDVQCAIGSLIANKGDSSNIEDLVTYMERMQEEFQVFTIKDIVHKDPGMFSNPHIQTWKAKHAIELFV